MKSGFLWSQPICKSKTKKYLVAGLTGLVLGFSFMIGFNYMWVNSSKNDSCMACHYHPEADASWKQSVHYNNNSGVMTDCAACHLPPKGSFEYVKAKIAKRHETEADRAFEDAIMDALIEKVEAALATACRRELGSTNISVVIDAEKQDIKVYRKYKIVAVVEI